MTKQGNYPREIHKCPECGKECKGLAALRNHEKTHKKDKKNEPQIHTHSKETETQNNEPDTKQSENKGTDTNPGDNDSSNPIQTDTIEGKHEDNTSGFDINTLEELNIEEEETTTTKEPGNMREVHTKESVPEDNKTIGQIQIIGASTGEKAKSTVDSIGELLFSEQVAPITLSIMSGLAGIIQQKLQGAQSEQEGVVGEAVSGAKIHLPNKNF